MQRILLSALVLSSCSPMESAPRWGSETLEWEGKVCSAASCPLARLTRPSFDDALLAEEVDAWIASSDLYGLPGDGADTNQAMEAFIRSGEQDDGTGLPSWWYTLVDVHVELAQEDFLSLSRYTDVYTGGFHGLQREDFLVLNAKTGEALSLADLIRPSEMTAFRAVAKSQFERQNGPIDAFWFDSGSFELPASRWGFGLSADGLEFAWSLYEINCYAYGIPRLSISWKQVENLLDWDGVLSGFDPILGGSDQSAPFR